MADRHTHTAGAGRTADADAPARLGTTGAGLLGRRSVRRAPDHRAAFAAAILAVGLLATAGCGDDDEGAGAERPVTSATTTTAAADDTTASTTASTATGEGTVEVTATDYAFEGLPARVKAGTKLTLTNDSDKEVHELVAILLPEGETRSADELVKLPEAEQAKLAAGPPAAVLVAPPGGAPTINAVGDGTLAEPGRYLLICSIPTGADPEAYLKAAGEGGGPPSVPGGPPHLVHGMYAEIEVT